MTLLETLQKIGTLQAVDTPYCVHRVLGKVQIYGDQISMYNDGQSDFVSAEEMQKALSWLVEELGGKVTWPKAKDKI